MIAILSVFVVIEMLHASQPWKPGGAWRGNAHPVLSLAALERLLDGLHGGQWLSIGSVEAQALHSEWSAT